MITHLSKFAILRIRLTGNNNHDIFHFTSEHMLFWVNESPTSYNAKRA